MSKKTYKDYYQDENFRTKRLEYMSEKVTCDCGIICSRVNLERHKRTVVHSRRIEKFSDIVTIQEKIVDMENKINKIQREIEASKKRIERIKKNK
jgi:hypothetical protein